MSVAAAVPLRQPALPLESTLVWARNGAFGSPQPAPASPSASSLTQCSVSAALSPTLLPLTSPAQLPGFLGAPADATAPGDDLGLDYGFASDSDGPQQRSCPLQRPQSPWPPMDVGAMGQSEPTRGGGGGCHCNDCRGCTNGDAVNGGDPGTREDDDGGIESVASRRQTHLLASTSKVAAIALYGDVRRRSFAAPFAGVAANGIPGAAADGAHAAAAAAPFLSHPVSRAGSCGGAATVTATVSFSSGLAPQGRPSSPQQPPILLSNGRSSGSGGQPRRPVYGVKTSAMTSQISAAQRTRAAIVIQAAWRGFRIRRLYLRLIVWRLRPPARQGGSYCGIREFPPMPNLPDVSLFTLYGRPSRFRSVKRRVWFGMEGPFWRTLGPPAPTSPATAAAAVAATATTTASATVPEANADSGSEQQQVQQQHQQHQTKSAAPPQPPQQPPPPRPAPARVQLRLAVPPRAEADVPMSEVERILAGGFWRVEEPAAAAAASSRAGGSRTGPRGVGGAGVSGSSGDEGEGEEGLSLYMRAKMRQEEREAEEALQMLSYEPHDLKHVLGSLKERTLERLGSLGRTIGETLMGARGHLHIHHPLQEPHQAQGSGHQRQLGAPWHWHWPGAGHNHHNQHHQPQAQARSLPRAVRWGSGAVGASRPKLYCNAPPPSLASSRHGGAGGGEWNLRIPLLTVVDAEGRSHTEVDPGGAAAPIAINWRRYRSRSHVTRMSF